MNKWLALALVSFAGGFGVVIANRLNDGALGVIAGVVVGFVVSAGIGVLILYATRGRAKPADPPPQQGYPGMPYGNMMMPPVVMMMPPQAPPQIAAPQQPTTVGGRIHAPVSIPYATTGAEDDF